MFEAGEVYSADPLYTFCPALHHRQLLHLFTKHFCQHTLFPDHNGTHSAADIRTSAVHEMYCFCHAHGLCEVWGYFWTSWYQLKMWRLWARSSKPYLPQWRTTMSVENFWRQLKHDYLHHLIRPQIDHLVWIIQTQLVPNYMAHATFLEDVYCIGCPKKPTHFQTHLKKEWARLSALQLSGRSYATDISKWQCNCDALKYNSFHICKHLVQAIPPPPPVFFHQVVRRRTMPLYQHPALCPFRDGNDDEIGDWIDPDAGSITDRDDHIWLGNEKMLTGGNWRELHENPLISLGKCNKSACSDGTSSGPDDFTDIISGSVVSGSEDEDEVSSIHIT